ncbi:histidine kinase [Thioclava sp. SK-1]|uniref:CBS domain-containing protein n=1 Tax=Thioclava sp. SK-1 TaxID=1889770 RepID=UPI0008271856|nr:CBS domain-containing protein [Thioclava sp. SK-1]OCX67131.1 histidine kinase [Thioclava sp. SK-1]
MQVLQILKKKNSDSVITIAPGSTIAEVAEVLSARRIGAIVVSRDGHKIDGIVSERDVVRELGKRGEACLQNTVDDIMTKKITTCERATDVVDVLTMMHEGGFRHMPVVSNGDMVGLISIRDVVAARLDELHMEKEALTGMIMGN